MTDLNKKKYINNNNKKSKSNEKVKINTKGEGYSLKYGYFGGKEEPVNTQEEFIDTNCKKLREALERNESNDILLFVLNSDASSEKYGGIEVISSKHMFDVTNFESLATTLAHVFAIKLGFAKRVEQQGEDVEQWFADVYIKLVTDFSKELIRTVIEDMYDNEKIKAKLLKALHEVDADNDFLKNLALAKNADIQDVPDELYNKVADRTHDSIVEVVGHNNDAEVEIAELFL